MRGGPDEIEGEANPADVGGPGEQLDMFRLKLLALMICRGSPEQKANRFFDVVKRTKPTKTTSANESISWGNRRLKAAIRFFIHISEMLPKQYYLENPESVNLNSQGGAAKGRAKRKGQKTLEIKAKKDYVKDEMAEWTEEYLDGTRRQLDDVFEDLYGSKFVDKIFEAHKTVFTKKQFLDALTPGMFGNLLGGALGMFAGAAGAVGDLKGGSSGGQNEEAEGQ